MFLKKILLINKSVSMAAILILTILVTSIVPIYAQFDFDSFLGNSIADGEIDGVIGSEWDDAGNYPSTAIEPTGTAEIWTKNDGTYLYIAIEFTADSSNPWVGIQFEKTTHMASGADGALFGHDRIGANEYRDISFGGFGSISSDTKQDGVGAINVGASNLVTIELKKPLSSGDSDGSDIDWNVDESYTLIILWDSNGGGSSGGSSGHTGSSQLNKTIFIDPNVIPEFSALIVPVVLVAIAILMLIFKRKMGST
jgi:hypothetical protein